MRVQVESYGCTLNHGEARLAGEILRGTGHTVVEDEVTADAHLLLTCTVIEYTERRMIARMKELAATGKPLVVSGCMASAQREKVAETAPGAVIISPRDLSKIASFLGGPMSSPGGVTPPPSRSVDAIVPIAQGCLGKCTYCITRLARGSLKSCDPATVLGRVRRYVGLGYREIRLTAQDSAAYGRDIGTTLPDLVNQVVSLEGDFRVRIGMANPATCTDILEELIDSYSSPKVFKFFHLPVQAGDDGILQAMGRGYGVSDFTDIVRQLRQAYPGITLSTDVIVGFPGENEAQFAATMRLIEDIKPDIVNVTRFSARPMTQAASMPGRVVGWRVKERSRRLTELRFKISRESNQALVGKVLSAVTIERGKGITTLARTQNYRQVVLEGELPLGRDVYVRIDRAGAVDVAGSVVEPVELR